MSRFITHLAIAICLSVPAFVIADEQNLQARNGENIPDSTYAAPSLQDGQAAFNRGNYDLAFSLWQTLATQGHADAQVFVGLSYANGWGVNKNSKLASHWYKKAAVSNNASGQFLLGLHLVTGKNADLPTGVMWLRRAADNGDTSAKRFMKKAKSRGWFDNVPSILQQEQKPQKVESLALADQI